MTAELFAGAGRAVISPELGTPLMGYPVREDDRRAETVRDELNATALALAQGDERALLLSCDVCLLDEAMVARIRTAIANVTDLDPARIVVSATHTHSAPRTQAIWGWCELDEDYCGDVLIPGAARAARDALAALVPVRVGIGTGVSDVGLNRRGLDHRHRAALGSLPWDLVDREMTVLRFDGAEGCVANLVHYGAHPTVLTSKSRAVSRDWPAIMCDRMERSTNALTLFVNGCMGDVAPRTGTGLAVGDDELAMWEAGGRAAVDAIEIWRGIKELRALPLSLLTDKIELPYRALPPRAEVEAALRELEADKDQPGRPMADYRYYQAVLAAHDAEPEDAKHFVQSILALGPVALVPMPGEPFTRIGLRLRQVSPFQHTLVAGVSNGSNGYLCAQEALCRGGYEPWVARAYGARLLVEHIDDVLVDENLRLLERLHG